MQIVILGGTARDRDPRVVLRSWWARPFNAGDVAAPGAAFDRHTRIVAVEPPGPPVRGGPFERAARAVRRYDVFPARIGSALVREAGPVRVGDAVGLRYRLLPGLELIFASRVVEVIDEAYRQGFTYRTLEGHPEKGEETFLACKNAHTGEVRVSLSSWSTPGMLPTRLIHPLARRLQQAAGRAALDHLEEIAGAT